MLLSALESAFVGVASSKSKTQKFAGSILSLH